MGIKARKCWLIYESCSCTAIDPEFLDIEEEKVRKYLDEHKMPEDPLYSKEDLIYDVCHSSGVLTLSEDINEENCTLCCTIDR